MISKRTALALPLLTLAACAMAPHAGPRESMILTRATDAQPDAVVDRIKSYAAERKWAFLGANKVKNGEITMVKVCIPAVGAALWSVDMKLTALLPCGNVSIYARGGKTEVAMLHPSYMHVVSPGAETEKAAGMAAPELTAMLDAVTR